MSLNNKEYIQWKKNRKKKRTLLGICIGILGIGGGIGIGYGIWSSMKSTPAKVYNEWGTNWEGFNEEKGPNNGWLNLNFNSDPIGDNPGTCSIANSNNYTAKDLVIPEIIQRTDGKKYRITKIEYGAFNGDNTNSNLTGNLTISDSVTSIEEEAFMACTKLSGITIGENVSTIGDSAFNSCLYLTSDLIIPDSVTSIGDNAFFMCGSGETEDGEGFSNIVIGENVSTIGDSAFQLCKCTGELKISDSVETIGSNAFADCYFLINVTIDHGAKLIGPSSIPNPNYNFFGNCELLNSIILNGFTGVDDWGWSSVAFQGTNSEGGTVSVNGESRITAEEACFTLINDYGLDPTPDKWTPAP